MKRVLEWACAGLVLVLCASAWSSAQAHGAHSKPYGGELRAYQFEYALGEPLRRAEVSVYPPDSEQRYVHGWTDAQGVFAFAPDRPGAWRLDVRDGKGHALQRYVRVGAPTSAEAGTTDVERDSVMPGGLIVVLAISLLLNAWLALVLLQRSRAVPPAPGPQDA
ncbi:MAG: hypothetical protein ABF271_08810 [Abyssibacter sp.]|uniref:hypothetical protein n=1 Tax=Abyssibacter sp. TaxID=2320200 RepID=UPI003219D484